MLGQPGASQMYSTNSSSWPSESGGPLLMVILGTLRASVAGSPPVDNRYRRFEKEISLDFRAPSTTLAQSVIDGPSQYG